MPTTKPQLRQQLLTARRRRPEHSLREAGAVLSERVLALPEARRAATVACYLSIGGEPPTDDLVRGLLRRGTRVLAPLLRADFDLDWADLAEAPDAESSGGRVVAVRGGPRGLREPTGPALGPSAVTEADLVIVPGLAADRSCLRLGRGGGSYDRVLSRLAGRAPSVLLLWDGELLPSVPAEPHDRAVTVVVTPAAVHRCQTPQGRAPEGEAPERGDER